MKTKKQPKSSIRYRILWRLLRPLVILFLKCKLGYRYQKARDLPPNYLVISNHATDYDPLLLAASFPRQMFFVGSEHIARWKHAYAFIKWVFAPIMRYKGSSAASAVMEIMRKLRQGSNVCLFPEGVRTWDGRTCPIVPSTATMIKRARCGLVTYKLTGGYFVSPMWSNSLRRGPLFGAPVHVYTVDEIASMTEEELYAAICRDLYEDAYERQLADPVPYRGKALAEGLENLLFICPECGAHDSLLSQGDTVRCSACALTFRYDEYGMLHGVPFSTLQAFAAWQKEQVGTDLRKGIAYTLPNASLATVEKHETTPLEGGRVEMTADTLRCGEHLFPLSEITDIAMHGQHALVFSCHHRYYELIPTTGNALKFLLLFQARLQAEVPDASSSEASAT